MHALVAKTWLLNIDAADSFSVARLIPERAAGDRPHSNRPNIGFRLSALAR